MKRAIGVGGILLFLILASAASAYVELEVYKDRCYADGSISVIVVNGKTEPLSVNETTLLVQNAYERNKTFVPEGRWTHPVTYYNFTTGKAQESMYIGNEDLITEPGDYHFFINYFGCRQGRCTVSGYLKNCLAQKMDCYKYKPLIYECAVDPDERMAYIKFGGEKNKFFTEVDPDRDLVYYITSDMRDLRGARRIEGAEFSKLGDVREMRFPLLKDETISDVAIVHNRCDSPFQQQKRVVCSAVAKDGRRGINNALRGERTGVVVPPTPAASPPSAQSTEVQAQQELVEKIIQQKEQEAQQRVKQAQQELEQTKAELDAYKQFAQQSPSTPEPLAVPKVTGAAVGTARGIPMPYLVVLILVGIGVVIVIATTLYAKKKREQDEEQKKEDERKEKSFGFGD